MTIRRERGAVGRGDLLRALWEADEADVPDVAGLLDFGVEPATDAEDQQAQKGTKTEAQGVDRQATDHTNPRPHPPQHRPIRHWFVRRVDPVPSDEPYRTAIVRAERDEPVQVLSQADIGRPGDALLPPPPPSIVAWPSLRRVMETSCRWLRPIGDVDVDRIAAHLERGEPILKVPRRMRRAAAARLVVIVDHSERLAPFWRDQHEVLKCLEGEFGSSGVYCRWWDEGGPLRGTKAERLAALAPGLGEGDVVLVLGDLGHYGADADRQSRQREWAELGASIVRRRADAVALMPCPTARWNQGVLRHWQAIDWSAPSGSPARYRLGDDARLRRRDDLLALISWVVRIELELLREVRSLLPEGYADVGTEADVWNHDGVRRYGLNLLLPRELRMAAQRRLAAMMHDERWMPIVRRVVAAVRARHAWRTRELWMEEARNLEWIDPAGEWISDDELEWVMSLSQKVRGLFTMGRGASDIPEATDVDGWAVRTLGRVPEHVWRHKIWQDELMPAFMAVRGGERMELLPGMDVGMLPPTHEGVEPRTYSLRLRGGVLVVSDAVGENVRPRANESPVARLRARGRLSFAWAVTGRVDAYVVRRMIPPEIELEPGRCLVTSDVGERVELRLELKPTWARAMGRDAHSHWVQYGEHRLDWPVWAAAVDEDEFGLWATFRVGEVQQRMRWIPPGEFLMGSPESEEGRGDDEVQHAVTLTQGFWMGDTPCTQALWEVVMGTNPSEYRSPQRPVESVSWDDVQRFLERLDARAPGLEARLPTEAQWEYACRAGTTTATYVGDLNIRGANDAPVLDAIAWYGGNSGLGYKLGHSVDSSGWPEKQYNHSRAGSRVVAQMQPNGWGLHDLLGNVYEWCADTYGAYPAATAVDPIHTWGRNRVLRGGGWSGLARGVRAAYRSRRVSGDRSDGLGFRVVRGQGRRHPEEEVGEAREHGREARARDEPGVRPASPRRRR